MEFLLFGYWGTPISSYLIIYFGLGAVGFLAAYFHRYLLTLIIPIIVWFSVSDYQGFYRYNVGPDNSYVFFVTIAMVLAVAASIIGAVLGKKKALTFR